MSKRNNKLLLEDILHSIEKIEIYTHNLTFEEFLNDIKTMDATVRNFEIIGEAANRLSEDFKSSYKTIEWNKLRGFRNRIVHDYFGIDYSIVWTIIEKNLHKLKVELITINNELKN